MIDINFLNGDIEGTENLRYQKNRDFYLVLTEVIDDNLTGTQLSTSSGPDIAKVVSRYSGFENVTVNIEEGVFDAYVYDVRFFTPSHVLRREGLEHDLEPKDSIAFKTLKKLEKDVLTGWVDYNTGKVHGDFAKAKCEITLDCNLEHILPPVTPKGITYAQAYALIVMHEVGHFFYVCSEIASVACDDYVGKLAVYSYTQETDSKKQIAVLKHAGELIELSTSNKELEEVVACKDPVAVETFLITKVLERDRRRALSLGVTRMTAEVMADAYAVRMGGGIDVAKIADVARRANSIGNRVIGVTDIITGVIKGTTAFQTILRTLPGVGLYLSVIELIRLVSVFSRNNMSGEYATPERRVTDIIKQMVQLIKDDQLASNSEKMEAIKAIDELRKIPIFDFAFGAAHLTPVGTIRNRVLGHLLSGGTWSRTEFAHYTSSIASHEVNLLEHKFNDLLK